VNRVKELTGKGWEGMTAAEQAEWVGNPLDVAGGGVNLIPWGPYYSGSVALEYRNSSITATATTGGVYLYAASIIGPAADYEGLTLTLSLDSVYTEGSASPLVSLYWHDANGLEPAGAGLTEAGSVTFTPTANTAGREYLAAYIYVTTDANVAAGETVRYSGLMLERGSTRHMYVPYTEVVSTDATKGAYNYADMNRVERAVAEIADVMGLTLHTKQDWGVWDVPTQADFERYLGNLSAIRSACFNSANLPVVPGSMNGLTYETANTLEKILQAVKRSDDTLCRSGELFCGEV
jgi:hypothetical protein